MLQLSGQHGQVGHKPFFRDILIVCLCRTPAGAHITMFVCRDIFLKLLPILKPVALNSNPPCVPKHLSQPNGGEFNVPLLA